MEVFKRFQVRLFQVKKFEEKRHKPFHARVKPMKIAVFNQNKLGIVQNDQIYDVTEHVSWNPDKVQESLIHFMQNEYQERQKIEQGMVQSEPSDLDKVVLKAPVPNPSKILAAPVNYLNHQSEMNAKFNNAPFTIDKIKLFLKAPSSVIGPEETILLPYRDRRHDHEAELAFVIGKTARNVSMEQAKDYIFGYFGFLDITMRGDEERTWRKSFDTFSPIGPWIVTSDEVGDPHRLQMDLWVNNELRQSINTDQMIYDCYKCLHEASQVMTLYPGDIITTGTPAGVGPIVEGDKVRLKIEKIGEFTVDVALVE